MCSEVLSMVFGSSSPSAAERLDGRRTVFSAARRRTRV
jgi:hypothetical protein